MSEYMTLLGYEQVQTAGRLIATSAEVMQRAALTFDASVERLVRALDDHAQRIEAAARGEV